MGIYLLQDLEGNIGEFGVFLSRLTNYRPRLKPGGNIELVYREKNIDLYFNVSYKFM